MNLVTFLGTSPYREVTYRLEGKDYTHRFFPAILIKHLKPEKTYVFITEEVEKSENWRDFSKEAETMTEVIPVKIPVGRNEEEFWKIFDTALSTIQKEEDISVDVTHAFRSLPLMVWTILLYVSQLHQTTIHHIYYGAYEAMENGVAPTFDLTPLMQLIQWTFASKRFVERMDGTPLGKVLQETHTRARKEKKETEDLPKNLQSIGKLLEKMCQTLHLCEVREAMKKAEAIMEKMEIITPEIQRWAKPFSSILEKVKKEIRAIGYSQPDTLNQAFLQKHYAIMELCINKGLYAPAVLMAREWFINRSLLEFFPDVDWLSVEGREKAEDQLNQWANALKEKKPLEDRFKPWAQVWDSLRKIRNLAAHAAFREEQMESNTLIAHIQQIPEKLKPFLENTPSRALKTHTYTLSLDELYEGTARQNHLNEYLEKVRQRVPPGSEVYLTGKAPIWLYLTVAHELHGIVKKLWYTSPEAGEILIMDHASKENHDG